MQNPDGTRPVVGICWIAIIVVLAGAVMVISRRRFRKWEEVPRRATVRGGGISPPAALKAALQGFDS